MRISGRWRNEYGSVMEIRSHAPSGEFAGVYSSDTGASGVYLARGWAPVAARVGENVPFCATLSWKPAEGGEPDPSWGWVSVMAGVLFLDAPGEYPRIQVLHGLVASSPLDAVEIDAASVFTETLTFQRIGDAGSQLAAPQGAKGCGAPFDLMLTNQIPGSRYEQIRLAAGGDGAVQATLRLDGRVITASGFIDPTPTGGDCSLALAALDSDAAPRALGLGGFIDAKTGLARLSLFEAGAVRYSNKYTAVAIGQELFQVT